jgi:hypothetical protein
MNRRLTTTNKKGSLRSLSRSVTAEPVRLTVVCWPLGRARCGVIGEARLSAATKIVDPRKADVKVQKKKLRPEVRPPAFLIIRAVEFPASGAGKKGNLWQSSEGGEEQHHKTGSEKQGVLA